MAATQIPSTYNFEVSYTDDPQGLKIIVKDSGDNIIFEDDTLETNTVYTITTTGPDTYTILYHLDFGAGFEEVDDETINILEFEIVASDWMWTPWNSGELDAFVSGDTYTFFPDTLFLNNNVCPPSPIYGPQIIYKHYELIDEVWEQVGIDTRDLSSWNGIDWDDIEFNFVFGDYPTKIDVVIRNCHQEFVYSTSEDGLFFPSNITNVHSEVQGKGSYNVSFSYTYNNEDGDHPSLVITPENKNYVKCDLFLYKNDVLIHSYENLSPTQSYPYTFAEASRTGSDGVEYFVRYVSTNTLTNETYQQDIVFTVAEYKPTFNLPTIQCEKINQNATIKITSLRFNCFANEESLHHISPPEFTPNINFKLYYLNPNTYLWELQGLAGGVNTPALMDDVETYLIANPSHTDTQVSNFLADKYKFGSSVLGLWTPNKLTMVKLVTTVTNYSTSLTKETIFPICGTWKIRRMSCGNYRIYNYTENQINFNIDKLVNGNFSPFNTLQVGDLTFESFNLPEDGVYKVSGGGLVKYIFNFCSIENCILELQKKVLLDDSLCNACKLDKVLYQKALRLIPVYETWKKLLDKDWVYEIQYQSTDIDQNLSAIYDADELYMELKELCDECTDLPKNCSCK